MDPCNSTVNIDQYYDKSLVPLLRLFVPRLYNRRNYSYKSSRPLN